MKLEKITEGLSCQKLHIGGYDYEEISVIKWKLIAKKMVINIYHRCTK